MKNSEFNVYTAESFMIPSKCWTEEILSNFPEDVRDLIEGEYPTGLGHHNELGWFVICAGQGPFLAWSEKGEQEPEEEEKDPPWL